jgi:PilZ domain
MVRRISRCDNASGDRRASNRLPIERDVRYKVVGKKKSPKQVGLGKTLNMSGSGVLFTTESALAEGELVELEVSWPARLNDFVPLKLVAFGRVVRAEETQAAIAIEKYEFRTSGSGGV